jgi:Histidine kinase/PAS fold
MPSADIPAEGVVQATNFREQFTDIADACALAQSIVDTVREPVLVLDTELRVIAASRSFYSDFRVKPEDTQGRLLYALGDGQWDIPKLRLLLEKIIPEHGVMEGYEVEHEFPDLGHRTMYLNARQVLYKEGAETTILLGIEDVTERRILEREKDELLRQKEVMLVDLHHRIANSLQIIAGIILLKAKRVESEETRAHLQDTHKRGRLGRSGAGAAPCLRDYWTHRYGALSLTAVHGPHDLDDWRQSTSHYPRWSDKAAARLPVRPRASA